MDEVLAREHVVQVNRQPVVSVGKDDQTRQAPLRAPGLHGSESLGAARVSQTLQVFPADAPPRRRENQPPDDDPRKKRSGPERRPVPSEGSRALVLELSEEAIDAEPSKRVIVGRGQPGNDAPVEEGRTKNDPVVGDRNEEIRDRDLAVRRGAGAAEERNLVVPKHRPEQDVSDPAFRQVNHLGEHGVGRERLLGPEVFLDMAPQDGVRLAEPSQHARARRPVGPGPEDAKVPSRERLFGGGGDTGHDRERIGRRRRILAGQLLEVPLFQSHLEHAIRLRLRELAKKEFLPRLPGRRFAQALGQVESLDQWAFPGGPGVGGGKPDPDLFIQGFGQWDLPPFVSRQESFPKAGQVVFLPRSHEPAQDVDPPKDLVEHRFPESRLR